MHETVHNRANRSETEKCLHIKVLHQHCFIRFSQCFAKIQEIGWKGFPARAFGERTAEKEDENRISCSTKPFKMSWPPRSRWSYRHLITASSSLVHFHNCRVVRFKKVHLPDLKSIFHSRSLSLGGRIFGPGKPGKRARDIILTSSLFLCAHTKGGRISRNLRTSTCHQFGGVIYTMGASR